MTVSRSLIWAEGPIAGYYYEYLDEGVAAGNTYYYQLEALETDGSSELHGPVSACFDCPTPTPTPTETPTNTPTETPTTIPIGNPTNTPEPTATPELYVRFWVDESSLAAGDCTILRWQTDNAVRVELDAQGVPGGYYEQTLCPCATETHILRVFSDESNYEDHTLTIEVSGSCTPVPPDSTSTPTSTPYPTVTPYQLRTATPTPPPTSGPRELSATPRRTATSSVALDDGNGAEDFFRSTATPEAGFSPTRTPLGGDDLLAPRNSAVSATATTTTDGAQSGAGGTTTNRGGGVLIYLVLGVVLMGLGGWGVWKSWRG